MGFEVVDSTLTHEGLLLRVRVDTVRAPDGTIVTREVVERPHVVAIVPVTADGEVVLVRQYRHAVGRYQLEIPAGLVDVSGESEEAAAHRELAEECGLAAGVLTHLTRFHNSAGWTQETTTIFHAGDLTPVEAGDGYVPEAEEAEMQVIQMPLTRAVASVTSGEITDAKSAIGLLLVGTTRGVRRPSP